MADEEHTRDGKIVRKQLDYFHDEIDAVDEFELETEQEIKREDDQVVFDEIVTDVFTDIKRYRDVMAVPIGEYLTLSELFEFVYDVSETREG